MAKKDKKVANGAQGHPEKTDGASGPPMEDGSQSVPEQEDGEGVGETEGTGQYKQKWEYAAMGYRDQAREAKKGTLYNSAALKVAEDAIWALNEFLKLPGKYRDTKKKPKDRLGKAIDFLIEMAKTEPEKVVTIKKEGKYHLPEEVLSDIHALADQRKSINATYAYIFDKYNLHTHKLTIKKAFDKYRKTPEYIAKAKSWIESIDNLSLFHQRGRVGALEELYDDAYIRYQNAKNKTNAEHMMKIIDQARKEAIPALQQITVNNNNFQQNIFTNVLAKEEQMAVFEKLPLYEIIIGKVAAKYNRDPYLLQRRLQNSYYAAQAGAQGLDKVNEPITYPTTILYNAEDLNERWKSIQEEESKVVAQSDITSKLDETPSDLKNTIKRKLDDMVNGEENE